MRIDSIPRATEPISLAQFLEAAASLDPYRVESVWAMREPLAALAQNREWIFSAIADELRRRMRSPWAREQPSYFVLHMDRSFGLRANIWMPERIRGGRANILENAAFSYDFPHDHNFDILTATCFGSGYQTEIYSYDELPAAVGVGDEISVDYLGRHRISPGLVFLYEANRDVHTQLPVDEITVTLNLLPFRREDHTKPQLIFEVIDNHRLRVVGVPLSPEGREMSALRMLAKLVSAGRISDAGLKSAARIHANPRIAAYAASIAASATAGAEAMHRELLREIDDHNVAFKYHEVAEIERARAATS
jgi:hypothetical protein